MDLTKLCFEGYHYDSNTVSKVDSVFYIKDDNEDDWIEIIPLSNSKEFYVVITVEGCETSKVELFRNENGNFVKS